LHAGIVSFNGRTVAMAIPNQSGAPGFRVAAPRV
jgi:hypothetical protein